MSSTNRYGLGRNIPQNIKEAVRKRDRFGCIICGIPVIEFDHVDPPFKDARSHDKDAIVCLCPNCHAKKSKGFISAEFLKKAMAAPFNSNKQYINYRLFDGATLSPRIFIGQNELHEIGEAIQIYGNHILGFSTNRFDTEKFFMSLNLCDQYKRKIISIEEDELIFKSDMYDFEINGTKISAANRECEFNLEFLLKDGAIHIRNLYYYFDIFKLLIVRKKQFIFITSDWFTIFCDFYASRLHTGFFVDREHVGFGRNMGSPYHVSQGKINQGTMRSIKLKTLEVPWGKTSEMNDFVDKKMREINKTSG